MRCARTALALLLVIAGPRSVVAQSFEGTVRVRQVAVDERGVARLLDGPAEGEGALDRAAEQLFSIPVDRVVALSDSEPGFVQVSGLTYHVKGTRIRVQGDPSADRPGYLILDFDEGVFQMVDPSRKLYVEWTQADYESLESSSPDEGTRPTPSVEALGISRTLHGMQVEAYEIRRPDAVSRVWVTPELNDLTATFRAVEERLKAMNMFEETGAGLALLEQRGFPILEQTVQSSGSGGGIRYELSEVLAVEHGPQSPDLFGVPADFEKKTMQDLMGGMPDPGEG